MLISGLVLTSESAARSSYSSANRKPPLKCELASCALPVGAIAFGGASATYVGAWALRDGELSTEAHVAGALAGGLATTTAILYATTSDPAPRYQTFGTLACLAVGIPALVLGIHGLVTADAAREAQRPGPVPNWYGPSLARVHVGPTATPDARGGLSPGLSFGASF